MRICFLLESLDISGGNYVVLQHAQYLSGAGMDVTLALKEPFTESSGGWHPATGRLKRHKLAEAASQAYDLVVATWWKTVLELPRFRSANYAYFVQAIESRFYSEAEWPLRELVEATYSLPLHFVTEATWISEYLSKNYGVSAALVRNGVRKELYRPDGPTAGPKLEDGRIRVLIEGQLGVARKNMARTIKLARKARVGEVWVLTSSDVERIRGVDRVFSRVPIAEVPAIYRSCDALLKLSYAEGMFGPPLEMFHCGGTAIVYDVTGHEEYIRGGVNALVADSGDETKVLEHLEKLRDSPECLLRLKRGAQATAKEWPNWDASSELFLQWAQCLQGAGCDTNSDELERRVDRALSLYSRSESRRLLQKPWIWLGYKLRALARRLPPTTVRSIRRLKYSLECF